ncbi:MAG: AIR synthase family protein [Chloroflexota bacterium]|jgi:hydrogenase maturation factor
MNQTLPVGKLPHHLLAQLISSLPTKGERVLLGPGIGLDCAVLEFDDRCLVFKTEPITFATQQIGWYAVQIAANDIATTGCVPQWMLLTILLPEAKTTPATVEEITRQVGDTCRQMNITLVGGHTEITAGLDRPILITTLFGEIAREKLITPRGAKPHDRLILTKGVPIEAAALLALEFPHRMKNVLSENELAQVQNFLVQPGISVLPEAGIAVRAGGIHAMHDPTEGGISTALWELAVASQKTLVIEPGKIFVPDLAARICSHFHLNPFGTIASGALLLAVDPSSADTVLHALRSNCIYAVEIGWIETGDSTVFQITPNGRSPFIRFDRDEITRIFETS